MLHSRPCDLVTDDAADLGYPERHGGARGAGEETPAEAEQDQAGERRGRARRSRARAESDVHQAAERGEHGDPGGGQTERGGRARAEAAPGQVRLYGDHLSPGHRVHPPRLHHDTQLHDPQHDHQGNVDIKQLLVSRKSPPSSTD